MNTRKILVVSAYNPNSKNEGGGPTGLLWEVLDYIVKELKIDVDIEIYPMSKGKIIKAVHRNGFYWNKRKRISGVYSDIIVYPEQMLFYLDKKDWKRTIVLGPDSPSLRDARAYRVKKTFVGKIIKAAMLKMARYNEYVALKHVKKYIVVGKADKKYMLANKYLCNKDILKGKIFFLRHPMLRNVIKLNLNAEVKGRRFIFSITPQKENEEFIVSLVNELKNLELNQKNIMEIVLVGKSSAWMKALFGRLNKCKVSYFSWIDDYADVCIFEKDVHCLPILAGSGTKNRALTALGSYLLLISTPIGIENIPRTNEVGVFITLSPIEFAKSMVDLNDYNIEINTDDLKKSRNGLIEKIKNEYTLGMNIVFGEGKK